MFNKIRFFIKKLKIKESEYNDLIHKANNFDKVASCIKIDIDSEYTCITSKYNKILLRFDINKRYIVSLKVKDIFKAIGLEFNKSVKFDIDTNMD